ncbi:hypothetical protein [Burkholderia sp. JP2-270]|uniref:hypothetical protein n=1 Tax=Burkholderia sp. JP2-270 TaxID=2217913 RepID=UPI001EF824F5|nr:hypothetical protein [Burkholderia sp. JP2-270]
MNHGRDGRSRRVFKRQAKRRETAGIGIHHHGLRQTGAELHPQTGEAVGGSIEPTPRAVISR